MTAAQHVTGAEAGPDHSVEQTAEPGPAPEATRRRGRVLAVVVTAILLLGGGSAAGLYFGGALFGGPDPATTPGPVDIGFSEDMTVHHQQAITMSELAGDRLSPPVRALAQQIERGQLEQVGQLQGWLGLWGAPLLPVHPMDWMAAPGQMPGMSMPGQPAAGLPGAGQPTPAGMPGMATEDELGQLQTVAGPALDVLYLQLMVRHHQGGLPMSQYAAQHAVLTPVRSLGATMAIEESQEVALMTLYLSRDGAQPLPAR